MMYGVSDYDVMKRIASSTTPIAYPNSKVTDIWVCCNVDCVEATVEAGYCRCIDTWFMNYRELSYWRDI